MLSTIEEYHIELRKELALLIEKQMISPTKYRERRIETLSNRLNGKEE